MLPMRPISVDARECMMGCAAVLLELQNPPSTSTDDPNTLAATPMDRRSLKSEAKLNRCDLLLLFLILAARANLCATKVPGESIFVWTLGDEASAICELPSLCRVLAIPTRDTTSHLSGNTQLLGYACAVVHRIVPEALTIVDL